MRDKTPVTLPREQKGHAAFRQNTLGPKEPLKSIRPLKNIDDRAEENKTKLASINKKYVNK